MIAESDSERANMGDDVGAGAAHAARRVFHMAVEIRTQSVIDQHAGTQEPAAALSQAICWDHKGQRRD